MMAPAGAIRSLWQHPPQGRRRQRLQTVLPQSYGNVLIENGADRPTGDRRAGGFQGRAAADLWPTHYS